MGYQNYKGDFIRSETFFRKEEDGSTVQIPVPEHVRIEYFTKGNCSRFVAERNGDEYRNCSLSEDGLSLAVNVALSRTPIGQGEMYAIVTEFITDYNFPGGERQNPAPYKTDVILYCGLSDLSLESTGISILASLTYGYSAYELAVKHGYEGTEEEWVDQLMNSLPLEKGEGEGSVRQTTAKDAGGVGSVALGENTEASGPYSFSEGRGTTAKGEYSHAEGTETTAGGTRSHAEGMSSKATGDGSHAEGYATIAEGGYSHTEGSGTKALNGTEHAQGKYNLPKRGKTIHTIGIGSGDNDRRNAEEVHTDGRKFLLGVGGYDGTNSETAKAVQEVLTNLVDLDSEQTISGAKTFITALIAKAGLNMVNTRIRKVGTPKDADDAATKAYVDALIQRLETAERKITELQNKLNEITMEE